MITKARKSNVITQMWQEITALFAAYDNLLGIQASYNNGIKTALIDATGDDPTAPGYNPGDYDGANQGIRKADTNQAMLSGMSALIAFVTSADGKKLEELRQ